MKASVPESPRKCSSRLANVWRRSISTFGISILVRITSTIVRVKHGMRRLEMIMTRITMKTKPGMHNYDKTHRSNHRYDNGTNENKNNKNESNTMNKKQQ